MRQIQAAQALHVHDGAGGIRAGNASDAEEDDPDPVSTVRKEIKGSENMTKGDESLGCQSIVKDQVEKIKTSMMKQYKEPDTSKLDLIKQVETLQVQRGMDETRAAMLHYENQKLYAQLMHESNDRKHAARWNKKRDDQMEKQLAALKAELKTKLTMCANADAKANDEFKDKIQKMIDTYKEEAITKCALQKTNLTEAHMQDIENLKNTHKEDLAMALKMAQDDAAKAVRAAENVAAAKLNQTKADMEKVIADLKEAHNQTKADIKDASALKLQAVRDDAAKTKADLEKVIAELKESHSKEMADVREQHEAEKKKIANEHAKSKASMEANHSGAVEALKSNHSDAVEALKGSHSDAVASMEANHSDAVEALKGNHSDAVASMEADHAKALEEQKSKFAQAKANTTKAHKAEVDKLQKAYSDLEAAKQDAEKACQEDKEGATKAHEANVQSIKDESSSKLSEKQEELDAYKVKCDGLQEALRSNHSKAVATMNASHGKALDDERANCTAAKANTTKAHKAEVDKLQKDLDGCTKEKSDLKSDLDECEADVFRKLQSPAAATATTAAMFSPAAGPAPAPP